MTVTILTGDCRDLLTSLADQSADCCITSPPYFMQRNYGVDGQIGLEPTVADYVASLVAVFATVGRVLKPEGSLWLNLGDTYAGSGHGGVGKHKLAYDSGTHPAGSRTPVAGFKKKDLIGIPWRVALALQDDGWYLRSANIWHKPNAMPESVEDRPCVAHEYVFQLTRQESGYFYDHKAVRTPPKREPINRLARSGSDPLISGAAYAPPGQPKHSSARSKDRGHRTPHYGFNTRWDAMTTAEQMAQGSSLRSVWAIAVSQFQGSHFATMPTELAELLVAVACPKGGLVLDPFGGAGTTGLVADRMQRDAILIELNPDYAAMAADRIADESGIFSDVKTRQESHEAVA